MKAVCKSIFNGSILIVLASVLCGQALAADVDTNGIETLRKTSKAFSAVAKQATPAVVAVQVRTTIMTFLNAFSGSATHPPGVRKDLSTVRGRPRVLSSAMMAMF
ncbi:MAG: hypothetical protein ACYSPJ_08075 [Planctomycetota bacterium]